MGEGGNMLILKEKTTYKGGLILFYDLLKQAFLLLWEDYCSSCYKILLLLLLTRDKLYQAFWYVANLLMKSFKIILFSLKTHYRLRLT